MSQRHEIIIDGQPGNPKDTKFGAQLARELAEYRKARDAGQLPIASASKQRLEPMDARSYNS